MRATFVAHPSRTLRAVLVAAACHSPIVTAVGLPPIASGTSPIERNAPAQASAHVRPATAESLTMTTDDGVTLYGEIYRADAPADAPVVLLFHQGRGSSAEYESIAPRLARAGFLAVGSTPTTWRRHGT